MQALISREDFEKIEMRVGTILKADEFTEAHKPAYKVEIDFGEFGTRRSSAQITEHYRCEDLPGKQVIAVVNFPAKQIGPFMSECLVLGVLGDHGAVTLLTTERPVSNGLRIA